MAEQKQTENSGPSMSLAAWNLLDDVFDHTQLAENFSKIDAHDCTPGRGVFVSACPRCYKPYRLAQRFGPFLTQGKGYCDEHGWIRIGL